jgi:MFS family permease
LKTDLKTMKFQLQIPPALKHRKFFLLWLGLMISVAGTQMQTWAMFWQIRTLTDQPFAIGLVGLSRILPVVIFSLIGGAMADTVNRRMLIFVTQSIAALLALFLAVLTFTGHVTLGWIYLLTALQATVVAFDSPARQSLVPNLLPAKELPNAFSMTSIAFQTGSIVGPALSGLVIAYWGQGYAYLINSISYLAVIIAIVAMGSVPQGVPSGRKAEVSLRAIGDGIRFILTQPIILSSMILDFVATFFASANTLLPFFARDVLKVGAVEYGWLSAAQSVGATAAALVMSQVREVKRQGVTLVTAVVAFGLATTLFGFTSTFWAAFIALVGIGASDSISTIIRNTIRQLATPDYMRGRMTSINQIFFMGGPQLGEVEAGAAAQFFGVPFALISGGIGTIIATGVIVRLWPQLLHFDQSKMATTAATAD